MGYLGNASSNTSMSCRYTIKPRSILANKAGVLSLQKNSTEEPLLTAAIYTSYMPDVFFSTRISEVLNECDHVFIVDNTPGGHKFDEKEFCGVTVIQDGINKGLGQALNLGVNAARAVGCKFVVLFDQDSTPSAGLISRLRDALTSVGPRTIIAPKLIDDEADVCIEAVHDTMSYEGQFNEVSRLATSGMFFELNNFGEMSEFSSDLFLDFVDFDWCWRMRSNGYRIYQIENIIMKHRLGFRQRRIGRFIYHIPAPFRHYFQFRDGLKLLFRRSVPPSARLRYSFIIFPKLLLYPFLLDDGGRRFYWMILGLRDAVLNVKGIGAARSILTKRGD